MSSFIYIKLYRRTNLQSLNTIRSKLNVPCIFWYEVQWELKYNLTALSNKCVFTEERGAKGKYPYLGNQSMCSNGKCEFFLTCWMASGLIEGSCGGFLYACCQRPDKEAPKTNEHQTNDVITIPTNYGPVINDLSKFSLALTFLQDC